MADISVPSHGKHGNIFRLRPNGFKGEGLNDALWGTGYNGAASGDFEVVIDHAGATDSFKWRKNGGAWTEDVDITGAEQTLSDNQKITFAATTGHTAGDQWSIGNLKDEATTESGTTAQITAAAKRLLNPNATLVWTDSGGAVCQWVDWSSGIGHFDKNVTAVTVTGNNGYVVDSGLQKLGYLLSWNMTANVDMADKTVMGDKWKSALPGMAGGSGGSEGFFIGNKSLLDELLAAIAATQKVCLVQLFTYDPDQDQTGSHFNVWVNFTGLSVNASMGEIVKESANFQFYGKPGYVANA
jgi:hypothetical protein